ncbi:site-specific integrase [Echinicola shivajiensis]|uniref:site-specific integrase n=1 Tax=Echinicola shivajiensis TaxID=1035916 RepID=UPI001BFC0AFD|nr:site-specific integrase [Echinicola shivajiensis]
MKRSKTLGIQFITRKNKAMEGGKVPVHCRITVDGKRVEISVKKEIEWGLWDHGKGKVKGNNPESRTFNSFLEHFRAQILESYQELFVEKKNITAQSVKNKFLGIEEETHTLMELIDYHNIQNHGILAEGTLKNYRTTKKHLLEFLENKRKRKDIDVTEINYKFITDYEYHLRTFKPKDNRRTIANNGVMKHLIRLKKLMTLAFKMEWITKDPFLNYKFKFKKVQRNFLEQEELSRIENKEFSIKRLDWVRDLFVFCCYTGLSYIDSMNLKRLNMAKGIDGEQWLITSRKKTDEPVKLPLLPKPLFIIEKYKNDPRSKANGTLFPPISNQKMNSYLKEIADLCGIEKNLTHHTARHTFATTVTLMNGVPIETVSKMLGHSKIATTQIYARVVEKKISQDMGLLRAKLF